MPIDDYIAFRNIDTDFTIKDDVGWLKSFYYRNKIFSKFKCKCSSYFQFLKKSTFFKKQNQIEPLLSKKQNVINVLVLSKLQTQIKKIMEKP